LIEKRAKPFGKYLLGADQFGRDILSRLIFGARVSLTVSILSVLIGLAGGVVIGTLSGYIGGVVDSVLMRLMDLLLSFPYLLLAIVMVAALGAGTFNTTLAIGIWALPTFARMVRASVLSIISREYITAAHAIGVSHLRIMFTHIIPNFISPIIVYATLFMANAIMLEAALSFLGLGVQPPTPSWGEMISSGRNFLMVAPHVATIPGLAIMLAVLGFNLMGDGLRDALDPKMKNI
jgi:peptide/nickel transport system permease protein